MLTLNRVIPGETPLFLQLSFVTKYETSQKKNVCSHGVQKEILYPRITERGGGSLRITVMEKNVYA